MVLDSGLYEAYWHRDQDWVRKRHLGTALELEPTWAMSFDGAKFADGHKAQASAALRNWSRDQSALGSIKVVPVVHGDPESLPAAVFEVAVAAAPGMIAVAERELGPGITARARVVHAIKNCLDRAPVTCSLHVLGTGSPLSVLIYFLAGADSFDGLEWDQDCDGLRDRSVVPLPTLRLL